MSEHVNLSPGTRVPKTGTYECCFCGPNGMAAMGAVIHPNNPAFKVLSSRSMRRHFIEGETFSECPNCGKGTGWSLVS